MKLGQGILIGVVLAGCGAGGEATVTSPAAPPPPKAAEATTVEEVSTEPEPMEAGNSAPEVPPEPFAGTTFPPGDFEPPHERSAKEGDGKWVRLGDARMNERAAQEPPVLYRTTIHPHEVSKFITVTVAAMDLKHTSLHLVAGTDDPGIDGLPESAPPGLVPAAHQDQLVLVHNGGFKPQHGNWGMFVEGTELVPPRQEGCTIVMKRDDTVVMGSWPAVAEQAKEARSYRQTPPCLLEDGNVHPSLLQGNARPWGGTSKDINTRRRTVFGIDGTGRVLYFGMGEEAEPRLLAEAMKHVGAVHATQLDINWNWTRFLLFGTEDGELGVTSTLIPKMVHRKRGYVALSQDRDFFYLKRR